MSTANTENFEIKDVFVSKFTSVTDWERFVVARDAIHHSLKASDHKLSALGLLASQPEMFSNNESLVLGTGKDGFDIVIDAKLQMQGVNIPVVDIPPTLWMFDQVTTVEDREVFQTEMTATAAFDARYAQEEGSQVTEFVSTINQVFERSYNSFEIIVSAANLYDRMCAVDQWRGLPAQLKASIPA